MNIGECVTSVILLLVIAFYVLLALLIWGRVLAALVSDLRRVKVPAAVKGPDLGEGVEIESGIRGLLSGGRKAHSWLPAGASAQPEQEEGACEKGQAVNRDEGDLRAA